MRPSARTIFAATLTAATLAVMALPTSGQAQGWDPKSPVCIDVYGRGGGYRQCGFTSIPECQATAAGRGAQCVINPYYAGNFTEPRLRRDRRRHPTT